MEFDLIIAGAGPGGLACADKAASNGLKTLVLERKDDLSFGRKVCAGGITWNGLLQRIDRDISENSFPVQHIISRHQRARIQAETPIIATVDRRKLGLFMAAKAEKAGAEIIKNARVVSINKKEGSLLCCFDNSTIPKVIQYKNLVGADGSASLVRKNLGLPVEAFGIGLHYQIPGKFDKMEWYLDSLLFRSGYAWVFPHRNSASIGAFCDAAVISASELKGNMQQWAKRNNLAIENQKLQAERISFDFRGFRFGNIFLIGDAAGLASALTGEGIYPAIVSGQLIAEYISDTTTSLDELNRLINIHQRHRRMARLAGKNRFLATLLMEMLTFGLKKKIIDFSIAEMAH